MHFTIAFLAFNLFLMMCSASANFPVVIWHGMGASCCKRGKTEVITKHLEEKLGVYVLSITTGGSESEQVYAGFYGNLSAQVQSVCAIIAGQEELQGGFNGVGLSQGGLFLRAVVEQCQHSGPRMKTLVTLGAPHQGVMNVPLCNGMEHKSRWSPAYWACSSMQAALHWGAYLPWVRDHIVQAQYFRDPHNLGDYLSRNVFLPDLNNEGGDRHPGYANNLAKLERLALFRFAEDFTVVPRDSAWFAAYYEDDLVQMRDTDLYKEDHIGLKRLDLAGRLDHGTLPGYHMQFTLQEFDDLIVGPYLTANSLAGTGLTA